MKKFRNIFAILLVTLLLIGALTACGANAPEENNVNEPVVVEDPVVEETDPVEVVEEVVVDPFPAQPFGENLPTAATIDVPLVVTYNDFSQKFSPFFSDSGYDADVAAMTQISILTTDRQGAIIENAIDGETVTYNGTDYLYKGPADISVVYDEASDTTLYTARLRVGMTFSDGVPVTIDDVIFSYYTFLDPSYVGSTSLASYSILGLKDYQTQTTSDVYDKYQAFIDGIIEAGDAHEWSDADAWTQEQQDSYWTELGEGWRNDVQGIIDLVNGSYMDYSEAWCATPADAIVGIEGMEVMYAMCAWGFGDVNEDGTFTASPSGTVYDLVETFPTLEDYYDETYLAYEGDVNAFFPYESATGYDFVAPAYANFIINWGPLDEALAGFGVPNISGIVRVDDYTVEVTVAGFEAPAVYSILGIQISPMHYYGDVDKYDFENNMFGFEFGDLSKQESLTASPMGAGAYKFVEYNNRVVYFEANELFYRGSPIIREIQFKETDDADVPSALQTGTADAGEMSYNKARFAEVASYNSDGEISGDVITMSKVDNLGYGYYGISAFNVKVGEDIGSEASKNLRKGFATAIAVFRDVGVDSYYGEGASVIQYPISNTSWAAPQSTDDDFEIAYSNDVDGNPIYTADMAPEDRYAAAQAASLGFFEAAGFTVEDGVLTAAPEGAKLSYELMIPASGTGDHPGFAITTDASALLAEIGMELVINDLTSFTIQLDAQDANVQELWTQAWGATIDPDMHQIYHSSNVNGLEGSTESNIYYIQDAALDQLILDGRTSSDQNYRKGVYKQALDIIMDWGVEVPNYQRKNAIIFSTERVVIESITPDITTYWGWLSDIELLEMVTN